MLKPSPKLSAKEKASRLENEISELQDAMSPEARAMLDRLTSEKDAALSSSIPDAIYHLDYRSKPVSLREFLSGKDYLGFLRRTIYPCIVDDLEELFEGNYTEVLLTGGLGWGKSRMAELGIIYELYRISCLRDPAEAYGLMPGSTLAFLNVSVTESQAKRVLFGGLFDIIRRSEYFRNEFPYDANIQSEIRFPRNVICYPVASNETSMLGEGVFSAAFDEVNFMAVVEHSKQNPEGGTFDQAVALYNRLSRRIRSRMNQRGRLPGHIWLISSARYPNDFTDRKESEATQNAHIFVRKYPAWGTRPRSYFLPENFKVEIGTQTKRTRVLTGAETDINPDRIIEVPIDFKEEFEKDPDGAVRDYAGVSILTVRSFIARLDLIQKMFDNASAAGLQHPFTSLNVTLQSTAERLLPERLAWMQMPKRDENGRQIVDQRTRQPATVPRLKYMRYAHVDLASRQDACGVCIVHIPRSVQVIRAIGEAKRTETRPIFYVDLLLRVVAPPHGEILAPTIRGLFYELSNLGMEFGRITYDSWGSHESLQILQSEGYEVGTLSVDATSDQYETLKTAIYDERVFCYHVPVLEEELSSLRLDEKTQKIDHPPRGSKDLADALCGAVWNAEQGFQHADAEALAPSLGTTKKTRNEELWAKVERGEPLTEAEFDALE